MTTGFLLLVFEEREICVECKEGLRHTRIKDPEADAVNTLNECLGNTKIAITLFIVLNVNVILDRGGLNILQRNLWNGCGPFTNLLKVP